MIKDPQQELFQKLKSDCIKEYGAAAVFDDGMPPDGTAYPFIYLGETGMTDLALKDIFLGSASIRIHVWGEARKRGSLSAMLYGVKAICRNCTNTGIYNWDVRDLTTNVITDDTTGTRLLHGVIDADYRLNGGTT